MGGTLPRGPPLKWGGGRTIRGRGPFARSFLALSLRVPSLVEHEDTRPHFEASADVCGDNFRIEPDEHRPLASLCDLNGDLRQPGGRFRACFVDDPFEPGQHYRAPRPSFEVTGYPVAKPVGVPRGYVLASPPLRPSSRRVGGVSLPGNPQARGDQRGPTGSIHAKRLAPARASVMGEAAPRSN